MAVREMAKLPFSLCPPSSTETITGSGLKCLYAGASVITLTLLILYWGSVE